MTTDADLLEQLTALRDEISAGRTDIAIEWLDAAIRLLARNMAAQAPGQDGTTLRKVINIKESSPNNGGSPVSEREKRDADR